MYNRKRTQNGKSDSQSKILSRPPHNASKYADFVTAALEETILKNKPVTERINSNIIRAIQGAEK